MTFIIKEQDFFPIAEPSHLDNQGLAVPIDRYQIGGRTKLHSPSPTTLLVPLQLLKLSTFLRPLDSDHIVPNK